MLEMDEWLLFVVMNEHDAPSVSLQYRAVLDQLLSRNSWDLSSRQEKDLAVEDEEGEEIWEMSECLVDESLRAFFVNGVVHLLEHDTAKTNKKTGPGLGCSRSCGNAALDCLCFLISSPEQLPLFHGIRSTLFHRPRSNSANHPSQIKNLRIANEDSEEWV